LLNDFRIAYLLIYAKNKCTIECNILLGNAICIAWGSPCFGKGLCNKSQVFPLSIGAK